MATSFLSRWSQRKLDETENKDAEVSNFIEVSEPETNQVQTTQAQEESGTPADLISTEVADALPAETTSEITDLEDMPVAKLLLSEAAESVKKAALRKMFLSEEFNVRDGLDDYDDDYSNLKSLSEDVAETLRDWVKEKTEEELAEENPQEPESIHQSDSEAAGAELVEVTELSENPKDLDIKTVPIKNDIPETKLELEEVRQNIPQEN
ncbi:DUF3306 domain-containing protein [Vibrio sp. AND4]|uniref:DUF3306 domain-containing protein n=1 Tax=Vibrio sp. AND4 TaxID=314289 RepID=UPI00015EFACB|nr:DUF3306 domain-containing protein [Vibrio sp. AND4]EDP60070.1 hypothetical protein AND4_01638 [Vibrio sp. AND4]